MVTWQPIKTTIFPNSVLFLPQSTKNNTLDLASPLCGSMDASVRLVRHSKDTEKMSGMGIGLHNVEFRGWGGGWGVILRFPPFPLLPTLAITPSLQLPPPTPPLTLMQHPTLLHSWSGQLWSDGHHLSYYILHTVLLIRLLPTSWLLVRVVAMSSPRIPSGPSWGTNPKFLYDPG